MNDIEDIIDELKEVATQTSFSLELPTEDEIVLVEEEILLPIPKDIKLFLLEVSDLLIGSLEPITVADPGSHTHLPEVTATAWEFGLPREFLPICQKGAAYYCADENGEIRFWENGELSDDSWEGIWSWAEEVWMHS